METAVSNRPLPVKLSLIGYVDRVGHFLAERLE